MIIGNPIMIGKSGGDIELTGITITTPPTKTTYEWGEVFDPTGMVVTATFTSGSDTTSLVVGATSPTTALALGQTSVTVSYTFGNTTVTTEQAVTVTKKTPTFSVSPTSVTLNSSNLTAGCIITTDSDGTVTASSNDSTVATASVSGTTITVSHVNRKSGSAIITATLNASANYFGASATIAVTAAFVSTTLENNSWDVISTVSIEGTGDTYWDVGDTKSITLNGTVGTLSLSNVSLKVFILDFNHPVNKTTADNNIIWGGFKTAAGVDVALCDGSYDSYASNGSKWFNMNHWGKSSSPYNTNYGGWKGCDLRYDILGGTSTAPSGYGSTAATSRTGYNATETTITSPVSNTLMAALPSDFRNVLRLHTHYVDNKGNSSNSDAGVTSVVDAIFLLSEFEIHGSSSYANNYEQNHQKQMAYYAAGNSKVKYNHSKTSTSVFWWCSSANCYGAIGFCCVSADGGADYYSSDYSVGLAPAFKT